MTEAAASQATTTQTTATAATGSGTQAASSSTTAATTEQKTGTQATATEKTGAQTTDPVYDIKAPEGFDAAQIPKLVEIAKVYGITPEKAQQLVNETHAAQVKAKADAEAAKAKIDAENLEAIKADKDYGGEKLAASLQRAQQVVDKLEARVPGLKAKLDGAMNDPVVVRLFNILGEGNREDSFITGGDTTAGAPKTLAEQLYPKP